MQKILFPCWFANILYVKFVYTTSSGRITEEKSHITIHNNKIKLYILVNNPQTIEAVKYADRDKDCGT